MRAYERLLSMAARLLGARDPDRRAEIVATALAAGRDAGPWGRAAELASLVALALRPRPASLVWLHGAVIAAGLAVLAALFPAPIVLALPFVLLAAGLLDARLAAAATLFWLWRLATADLAAVVAALGDTTLTAQLARWLLMLLGLAIAARVTRASIRRAASL